MTYPCSNVTRFIHSCTNADLLTAKEIYCLHSHNISYKIITNILCQNISEQSVQMQSWLISLLDYAHIQSLMCTITSANIYNLLIRNGDYYKSAEMYEFCTKYIDNIVHLQVHQLWHPIFCLWIEKLYFFCDFTFEKYTPVMFKLIKEYYRQLYGHAWAHNIPTNMFGPITQFIAQGCDDIAKILLHFDKHGSFMSRSFMTSNVVNVRWMLSEWTKEESLHQELDFAMVNEQTEEYICEYIRGLVTAGQFVVRADKIDEVIDRAISAGCMSVAKVFMLMQKPNQSVIAFLDRSFEEMNDVNVKWCLDFCTKHKYFNIEYNFFYVPHAYEPIICAYVANTSTLADTPALIAAHSAAYTHGFDSASKMLVEIAVRNCIKEIIYQTASIVTRAIINKNCAEIKYYLTKWAKVSYVNCDFPCGAITPDIEIIIADYFSILSEKIMVPYDFIFSMTELFLKNKLYLIAKSINRFNIGCNSDRTTITEQTYHLFLERNRTIISSIPEAINVILGFWVNHKYVYLSEQLCNIIGDDRAIEYIKEVTREGDYEMDSIADIMRQQYSDKVMHAILKIGSENDTIFYATYCIQKNDCNNLQWILNLWIKRSFLHTGLWKYVLNLNVELDIISAYMSYLVRVNNGACPMIIFDYCME